LRPKFPVELELLKLIFDPEPAQPDIESDCLFYFVDLTCLFDLVVLGWVGRVAQNGPMDNSELQRGHNKK